MFIIGVDPHRGSHAAVVLDDHEQICDELALVANLKRPGFGDCSGYWVTAWAAGLF